MCEMDYHENTKALNSTKNYNSVFCKSLKGSDTTARGNAPSIMAN